MSISSPESHPYHHPIQCPRSELSSYDLTLHLSTHPRTLAKHHALRTLPPPALYLLPPPHPRPNLPGDRYPPSKYGIHRDPSPPYRCSLRLRPKRNLSAEMRNSLCPYTPNPHPKPNPLNPPQSQANAANDITQANDQLDIAAKTFVPKVPCATISAAFGRVRILYLRLPFNPLGPFPLVTHNKTTKDCTCYCC